MVWGQHRIGSNAEMCSPIIYVVAPGINVRFRDLSLEY